MPTVLLSVLLAVQAESPNLEELGFSAADAAHLSREKIVLGREEFTQSYLAYRQQRFPYFITSDALLNAFHVLFAESVMQMETRNAHLLPGLLRRVETSLRGVDPQTYANPALLAKARDRALHVVTTARVLLGERDGPAAEAVEEVVRQIEDARGQGKPAWLGPPDPDFIAIDYGRFRPRGFYTRTDLLQRYFRAVAWLQAVPFRAENDEELLAIMLLGRAAGSPYENRDVRALTSFKEMTEQQDELDMTYFGFLKELKPQDWQHQIRLEWELRKLGQIRDQLTAGDAAPRPSFRVLSALRLPDAVLFQKTTSPLRPFPTGLEVAAILDSPLALPADERGTVGPILEECRGLFKGSGLYQKYLGVLRKLFAEPDQGAPAFMKSEAWRLKSRQTALAGWAQMRHTWALQAKQSLSVMSLVERPPGFVEPNPEFFTSLADLAETATLHFEKFGAFRPDPRILGEELGRRFSDFQKRGFKEEGLDGEAQMLLQIAEYVFSDNREWTPGAVTRAEKAIAQLQAGTWPTEGAHCEVLQLWGMDLGPLWRRLQACCLRLASLAERQLRQADFSKSDKDFLEHFGTLLGNLMLYEGNSGGTPRDDAPKIVDVHRALGAGGGSLHVGVGRPRALYVLYPYQGKEWLCLGAVLPYYEFRNAVRLTDAEWRQMLSDRHPPLPDWMKPLEVADPVRIPAKK